MTDCRVITQRHITLQCEHTHIHKTHTQLKMSQHAQKHHEKDFALIADCNILAPFAYSGLESLTPG